MTEPEHELLTDSADAKVPLILPVAKESQGNGALALPEGMNLPRLITHTGEHTGRRFLFPLPATGKRTS
jgi:hypothetical protein